jgi:hypothetical protein
LEEIAEGGPSTQRGEKVKRLGLQSIFKNQDGLLSGFVDLGGDEATLRRLVPQFGPFLESAKNRDVAVLAGFRF